MEIFGFVLLFIGMAGMDSEGKWIYLAVGMIISGCFLIYFGETVNDIKKEGKRKWH